MSVLSTSQACPDQNRLEAILQPLSRATAENSVAELAAADFSTTDPLGTSSIGTTSHIEHPRGVRQAVRVEAVEKVSCSMNRLAGLCQAQ